MSDDPNQSNPPEQPVHSSNEGGNPTGEPSYPLPSYPGGPGYPPSGYPGGPGYPPSGYPGGPGYPPPGYPGGPGYPPPFPYQPYAGDPPPPQFTPKPLDETLEQLPRQYWRVLSHPNAKTFAEEQAYASWGVVWIQLIGLNIISAIFTFLFYKFTYPIWFHSLIQFANLPEQQDSLSQMANQTQTITIPSSIFGLFSSIVGFFITTGIFWLIAKAFRGKGPFLQYIYCYLLIYVPISIIIYIVLLIPYAGPFMVIIPGIYALVLFIMMTSGVHRLSGGKATLAVLILPIIALVLACALGALLLAVILNAVHTVGN